MTVADKNRVGSEFGLTRGFHSPSYIAEDTPNTQAHLRDLAIMLITLALLVLWILSMYFYLPLPIVVLLFAALATGTSMTVWQAWMDRKQRLAAIGEQDSNS